VGDIADKVGIARSTAGQHLAKMADGGLINMRAEGTKKMYSTGEVRSASESAKPSAKTPLRAKAKVNPSDIELAVKGVCSIIIGRSAAGRLRIQIEELS
jgi:DNA-binding transcriptional ArsR family regulator